MNSDYAEWKLNRIFTKAVGDIVGFVNVKFDTGLQAPHYKMTFTLRTARPDPVMKMFDSLPYFTAQVAEELQNKEYLIDVATVCYLRETKTYWQNLRKACSKIEQEARR